MTIYVMFMATQWYLLGREIDHRFKIYFRVNSSMDRIIYRVLLGHILMVLVYGLMSLISSSIVHHFFWGFWILVGLFYSWPTRGKIIEDSLSEQLQEFRYLDGFEKTVIYLIGFFFIVSLPYLPQLSSIEGLKLYLDPYEYIHPLFWRFLYFNYFPFARYQELFTLAWGLHFYLAFLGLFLLTFYGILRYVFSRRLSILGLFAFLSSWSIPKLFEYQLSAALWTYFPILWIWAMLWCIRSGTYRSGLILGLIHFLGALWGPEFSLLYIVSILLLFGGLLKNKTHWYRKQLFKYTLTGLALTFMILLSFSGQYQLGDSSLHGHFGSQVLKYIDQKGLFGLAPIGLLIFLAAMLPWTRWRPSTLNLSPQKTIEFACYFSVVLLFGNFLAPMLSGVNLVAWLTFFSLIPLEWIFQSMARMRSRRNFIYVIYVLICLLDSHVEGRIKIFAHLF